MHNIGMTMQQVQVNTKFLNALPPEWSKFVTNVKLAKSLYTTNYDQLYAYLSQHERHANEQGEDLIDCINKAMTFLSAMASSFDGTGNKGIATTSRGNYAAGQPRVMKCYNCQGEGHMAASQILDEEQLAFLADPGINEALVAQQTIPQNLDFQTEDLDVYDSDCDDISSAKAVLMANLSSCDPVVLFEVPYSDSYLNDMINQESKEKESKYIDKEIVLKKQNKELENIICKMHRSTQAMHMLTKPQVFYDDTHKQALGYQNPFNLKKAQRIKQTLNDGSVIVKEHDVISVIDDEETLILEEESRSKMLDKQNDPISIEKKI
ncbi:retrovirus-related pol polyprotein from transposon TNT 1-94 [Tanacetum coccineum]